MARVLIRTQAWGSVTNSAGLALPNLSYVIKNTDGSAATHWSAETGGSSSTSNLTTDADGGAVLSGADRWVEMGEYDITVNGKTYRVTTSVSPSAILPVFNVVGYGAKGDGTTDNYTAITNAISDAASSGTAVVFVPAATGFYRVSQTLQIPNGVMLKGANPNASIIAAATSFTGTSVVTNTDHTGAQEFAWLEDIQIHATNHANVAILWDTLFVNSGLKRVIATNGNVYSLQIANSGSSGGPVYLRDVWALAAGQDCIHVTGAMRQLWCDNTTAETPGAGFAAFRIIGTGGTSFGHRINGLHMENYSNGLATGLVLDGAVNVDVQSVFAAGQQVGGAAAFDDVVQIKNSADTIELRNVNGATTDCANIIHDTVNSITIPAGTVNTAAARVAKYKTTQPIGPSTAILPRSNPTPASHGLLAWSFDPALCLVNPLGPTVGRYYVSKIEVPQPISVTNVLYYIDTIGSTGTSGQNFVGLLSSSGTLIASSADQTSTFDGTTGLKTVALSGGPYAINGGPGVFVYVVWLFVGGTAPKFAGVGNTGHPDGFCTSAGLATGTARGGFQTTANTALASITLSSNSVSQVQFWAGLS